MKNLLQVAKKPLVLGTPDTISMTGGSPLRRLLLRLNGSMTIAAGGGNNGTIKPQAPWNVISQIMLRRNSNDTVISIPAWLLWELNRVLYGTKPQTVAPADDGVGADKACSGSIILPFENILGINPFDTLLVGDIFDFMVNTADVGSMVAGGDRVHTVGATPFTLEVTADRETDLRGGNILGNIRLSLIHKQAVGGASANYQIKPIGVGNAYKGFLIFAEDAGLPSNNIINQIKLKCGNGEVPVDVSGAALREAQKSLNGQEALSDGVYYLDLMPDGRLGSTLDVRKGSGRDSLEFELNVNAPVGTGYIYVVALEYVPQVIVKK